MLAIKFDVRLSMRLLKQVLSVALNFFLIYAKMTLTQFFAEIYFLLQMMFCKSI